MRASAVKYIDGKNGICYNFLRKKGAKMFENIKFKGTFRTYQQKILDSADEYLSDGRINIVAAPGSGKTILGLEIIRRLGKPCLILSPTTTIREQWGERFTNGFTGDDTGALVSFDLKNPAPITSVTYQALYSAAAKVKCLSDGEEVDNSSIDLAEFVKKQGVGTLCLDEAHHLQNEWQKALEKFISENASQCTVISLTATPPYDASPAEWKRYTEVCGEIDEEICVPELVRQGTLCPHQDYVYICRPSAKDGGALADYNARVNAALDELKTCAAIKSVCANLTYSYADLNGWLDEKYDSLAAVINMLKFFGLVPDKRLLKNTGLDRRADFCAERAEVALDFILSEEKLLFENERAEIAEILKKHKLTSRGKPAFEMDDKLKRMLASSVGKLEGIGEIAKCEEKNLGDELRLLVLTDFIKRDDVKFLGEDKQFDSVSIISVFETLRKNCSVKIGALSGGLVILPDGCAESLKKSGASFTMKPLGAEGYSEFMFSGGNRNKVNYVGKLFENGEIKALVGTKSLLGEVWDAPCVNALILASFVGSFMLSNQMRGRAIRVDKNNPQKTANIWHLVTVPPSETETSAFGKGEAASPDFETLERRFLCFAAPDYFGEKIRSGIDRLGTVCPPYKEEDIKRINADMCSRSRDRDELKYAWDASLLVSTELRHTSEVPADRKFPAFTLYDVTLSLLLIILISAGTISLFSGLMLSLRMINYIGDKALAEGLIAGGAIILMLYLTLFFILFDRAVFKHFKAENSVEKVASSVLQTLKDIKMIPKDCELKTEVNPLNGSISVQLTQGSLRSQKLFGNTLSELYSPIDCPRYVIVPRKKFGYNYRGALACPEILGTRREYVEIFVKNLKQSVGRTEAVYTRGERGRAVLRNCRRFAYVYGCTGDVEDVYGN